MVPRTGSIKPRARPVKRPIEERVKFAGTELGKALFAPNPTAEVHRFYSDWINRSGGNEEKAISTLSLLPIRGVSSRNLTGYIAQYIKRHGLSEHITLKPQAVAVSRSVRETRSRAAAETVSTPVETTSLIHVAARTPHGNEFLARLLVQAIAHGHGVTPPRPQRQR